MKLDAEACVRGEVGAVSKGVHPKFVQELLGYAAIAIILDTYSHVIPGMGGGTADAIDEALR